MQRISAAGDWAGDKGHGAGAGAGGIQQAGRRREAVCGTRQRASRPQTAWRLQNAVAF